MAELYDRLTYDNLMAGLALHFQRRPQRPLTAIEEDKMEGPGVYALFYAGDFGPYAGIANGEQPIYVGKAVPHPGRSWAAALTGGKDIAEATAKVMAFLNKNKG